MSSAGQVNDSIIEPPKPLITWIREPLFPATVQPIKLSKPMLSVALSCSPQPYYAANPYSLTLQKVVKVSAMEEGHWHLENFLGCTVG